MIPRILRTRPIGWPRRLALASSLVAVFSCQTTTIVEEESSAAPGKHYVHFRVSDSAGIPDSIWYRSPLDSGTESFSVVPDPVSGIRIVVLPFLNQIGDRDSMIVTSFRMGVRTGTSVTRRVDYMELGANRQVMTGSDSLAVQLFRVFDSLRKAQPNLFPSKKAPADSLRWSLQNTVAEMVFRGHPASQTYRRVTPVGLDTAKIQFRVLTLAVTSGLTLGEVVRKWNLGMDYATARGTLANLKLDSLSVNPFRQLSPLGLDTLHLGEPAKGLTGRLQGAKGIAKLTFSIWNDSGDRSNHFILADAPDLEFPPIQLNLDRHPTFAPRSNTSIGAYSLLVRMDDSLGNQETYRVPFQVADSLDHTGPTIRWINPSQNKVFDHQDSLLTIQVEATDPSGVDSVWIDGRSAQRKDRTWTLNNWQVPVSDLGVRLRAIAQDHFGNRTDSFLVVSRRPAPVFASPTLSLVSPAAGTIVEAEEDSTEIVWKATTPDHKVDSVWIDGRLARNDSGQFWRLRVSLPPTRLLVVIPVRAHSTAGTESKNFAQFGRHRDTVGPLLRWERPQQGDTLPYSTALAEIEIRAADHFGTDAVWIDGSQAKLSGGIWKGSVLLGAPGSRNQITVRGRDRFGNLTDSILTIHRGDLPDDLVPTFRPLKPSQRSGVHVPYDSTSIWVRWVISDLSGIDSASVQIDHQPALKENDSTWGARVSLPPVSRKFINIIAKNKKGNAQADVMEITRDPESSIPKFERAGGLRDTILFGDSTFKVQWKVTDNALATVKIGGIPVRTAGDIFSQSVSLNRGVQWIRLEAEDSSRNICRDSIRILYLPGMKKIDSMNFVILPAQIPIEDNLDLVENEFSEEISSQPAWGVGSFFSDTTFVTMNEFLALMRPLETRSPNNTSHMTWVSWYEAVLFCNKKSRMYHLPEAYITSDPDSTKWHLVDNPTGFKLPSMGEAYGFRAIPRPEDHFQIFSEQSEWLSDWKLTSIETPTAPPTGSQRAILRNTASPDVLTGLPPESAFGNLVFRTVLPLKVAQVK